VADFKTLLAKRRQFYKDSATIATQKAENQAARHIISGLGYASNALWHIEKAIGLEMEEEATELQHARAILDAVSGGSFTPSEIAPSKLTLDVREEKNSKKWILTNFEDLAEEAARHEIGSIVIIRDQDPKRLLAFAIVQDVQTVPMWLLQKDSLLLDKRFEMQVWCRHTKPLIYDMARYLRWDLPTLDGQFQAEKKEDSYVPIDID